MESKKDNKESKRNVSKGIMPKKVKVLEGQKERKNGKK